MACFKPIVIKDLKNMKTQHVACGKCNFCRQDKSRDWSFRLMHDVNKADLCSFVTLTYNDAHLPREPFLFKGEEKPNPNGRVTLVKSDLQQFHKSLKEQERNAGGTNLSYYAAGEYGTRFGRPHYHTILMNHRPETISKLEQVWNKGHIHIGTVTPASVAYVAKYIIDKQHHLSAPVKPFNMMSKGIGASYLSDAMIKYHRPDDDMDNAFYFVKQNGFKAKMPRYYRDRIFSDEERRELGAMQYQLGMIKKADLIEYLALQELETQTVQKLSMLEQGFAAWERGLKRYLEQVEFKHEKISSRSLQLNKIH